MRELPQDHHCPWREEAEALRAEIETIKREHAAQIASLTAQLEKLTRYVFGKRSEKMPPMDREVLKNKPLDPAKTKERRRANAATKQKTPERRIDHPVAKADRICPHCGGSEDLRTLGDGKETTVFEYLPPRFEKQIHVQEVLACRCGGIITAEGAAKVIDKTIYGPGLLAHTIVSKCGDSLPLYRLAKQFRRLGIPMARSTLTDLFHRGAELLAPLGRRIIELVAEQPIVQADETVMRIQHQDKCKKGYLWTFLAMLMVAGREINLIAFRFSPSRSGKTPVDVLGNTRGTLVVDAYTGYNAVTTPDGRVRSGCMAHVRRKFFDALTKTTEAQQALELIRELYVVEHQAWEVGVVRTAAHRQLRQELSGPIMDRFRQWLDDQKPKHLPKGPMGEAIAYALNNWPSLTIFLGDEHVPIDNNASENALRVAALGRKNYLFVGNDTAGENIAALYTLVATCDANGVNPTAYITDVLIKTQDPAYRLDDLLPHTWKPPPDLLAQPESDLNANNLSENTPLAVVA